MKNLLLLFSNILRKQFKIEFHYRLSFFIQFANIPIGIFSFFFFSKIVNTNSDFFSYDLSFLSFAVLGMMSLEFSTLILNYITRMVREEQISGILEEIELNGISFYQYFLASSAYPFFLATLKLILYLIILILLKEININILELFLILNVLIFSLFAMSGIAIIASSFILYFKKGNFITSIYITLAGLIAGIIYPTSVLPEWLQNFSFILPTFHMADLLRNLAVENIDITMFFINIIWLGILAFFYNIASFLILKLTIKEIKKNSSLAEF